MSGFGEMTEIRCEVLHPLADELIFHAEGTLYEIFYRDAALYEDFVMLGKERVKGVLKAYWAFIPDGTAVSPTDGTDGHPDGVGCVAPDGTDGHPDSPTGCVAPDSASPDSHPDGTTDSAAPDGTTA